MMNNDMICLLKADLFKLKKHKSVWIGVAVMFAMILLQFSIYWLGLMAIDSFSGIEEADPESANAAVGALKMIGRTMLADYSGTAMISLLTLIITCIFIGKEFSNGTVRILVSRGSNRIKLFFSKWISLACLIAAYSVFAFLVCGIFTSFKGYGIPFTGHEFGMLMRCFVLQILCNLSSMSIALMIAFLVRSSGGSIGACIGFYIGFSIVLGILSTVSIFSGNMNTDWVIFMPLQQSSIAGSLGKLSTMQTCAVSIMPIVYGAIAIAIGLVTFLKRDIK